MVRVERGMSASVSDARDMIENGVCACGSEYDG